jgi:hypothetical protein
MPAKRVASLQRRLQIHWRTNSKIPKGGQRKRLTRDISGKGVIQELGSGKTAPLHTDAIANPKVARLQLVERNDNTSIATAILASPHLTHILHDSSKHDNALTIPTQRAKTTLFARGLQSNVR